MFAIVFKLLYFLIFSKCFNQLTRFRKGETLSLLFEPYFRHSVTTRFYFITMYSMKVSNTITRYLTSVYILIYPYTFLQYI